MHRRKTALAILLTVAGLALVAGPAEAGWFYRPYIGWRGVGLSPYGVAGDLAGGQIVGAAQWQRPAPWQQPVIVFTAAQWQQMVQGQQPNVQVLPVLPQATNPLTAALLPQATNPLTAALLRQQQRDPRFSAIWQQQQQQSAPSRPPADGK